MNPLNKIELDTGFSNTHSGQVVIYLAKNPEADFPNSFLATILTVMEVAVDTIRFGTSIFIYHDSVSIDTNPIWGSKEISSNIFDLYDVYTFTNFQEIITFLPAHIIVGAVSELNQVKYYMTSH